MQKIFNENGRMDQTTFLVNKSAERLNLYFNTMANPEPYVLEPGEIAQCDGGVASIFMGQTWKYEIVTNGGDPNSSRMVNERFGLAAFNTKEEAEAFSATLLKPAAQEQKIVIEDYTPPTKSPTEKKLNYSFMKREALVAIAKEKYGAEFSEDAKRQEIIDFLKENANS